MSIRAVGHDGVAHVFPDGTPDNVIDRVMKDAYAPTPTQAYSDPESLYHATPETKTKGMPEQRKAEAPAGGNWIDNIAEWATGAKERDPGVGEFHPQKPVMQPFTPAMGFGEDPVSFGWQTEDNPESRLSIFKKRYPKAEFRRDQHGNVELRQSPKDEWQYLNTPGFSTQDIADIVNDTWKTAPAMAVGGLEMAGAKTLPLIGKIAPPIMRILGAIGAGSGTEAASQGAATSVGGKGPNASDVARSGVTMGLGQTFGEVATPIMKIMSRFGAKPDERAARLIQRAMERGEITFAQLQKAANKARTGGVSELMYELFGEQGKRLMRATHAVPGPGNQVIADALEGQRKGLYKRVTKALSTALFDAKAPEEPAAFVSRMEKEAVDEYNRLYDDANAKGGIVALTREKLGDLGETIRRGLREAATPRPITPGALTPPPFHFDPDAPGVGRSSLGLIDGMAQAIRNSEKGISRAAAENTRKGLSALRTKNMAPTDKAVLDYVINAFDSAVDHVTPPGVSKAYEDARKAFFDKNTAQEYFDEGTKLLGKSDYELAAMLRGKGGKGLDANQKHGLMMGAIASISESLGRNEASFLRRMKPDSPLRNVLNVLIGDKGKAQKFVNRIARETESMTKRNFVQGNSQTARIQEDIRDATVGEDELDFINDLIANKGDLKNIGIKKLAQIWDSRRAGVSHPAVNRAVAEKLSGRATIDNTKDLIDQMQTNPLLRRDKWKDAALGFYAPAAEAARKFASDQGADDRATVWQGDDADLTGVSDEDLHAAAGLHYGR